MTKLINKIKQYFFNSPLLILQEDDSVICTLWYNKKMAVCPECLKKGIKNLSYGFYEEVCTDCNTNMKPIELNYDGMVTYKEI